MKQEAKKAWKAYNDDINEEKNSVVDLLNKFLAESDNKAFIQPILENLKSSVDVSRKEIYKALKEALYTTNHEQLNSKKEAIAFIESSKKKLYDKYSSFLYSEMDSSSINVEEIKPSYNNPSKVDGRIILRENFKAIFSAMPEVFTFGEDTGKIGGVNQAMEGMQEEFG